MGCDMNEIKSIVDPSNVRRCLQSFIRLHSLVSMGCDMNGIKSIFETSNVRNSSKLQEEICSFASEIDPFEFNDFMEIDYADSAII